MICKNAFEKWAKENSYSLTKEENGRYFWNDTRDAAQVWGAATQWVIDYLRNKKVLEEETK